MTIRSVMVTGGDGLLGRELVTALRERYSVSAIVHTIPPVPVPDVTYTAIDFGGDWTASDLPPSVDAIVHLAQSSNFRQFPEMAGDVFRVNIASTARLLDYANAAGAQRFLYASSGGIYGSGTRAFDETAPAVAHDQLSYYLGSKLCSEVLAQNYARLMQVTVFRVFFMYGARQKRSMLMPRLVDNVREGRPVTLQGEAGLRLNPVHVSDASAATVAALDAPAGTYNIAGPEVVSLREICERIGRRVGREPVFEHGSGAPSDLIGDIAAMRRNLYEPTVTIDHGIEDLL